MRPLTEHDILAVYRQIVPTAIGLINSGLEARPQLFFFEMSKARPGTIDKVRMFDPKTVVQAHENGVDGTRLLMRMIKAVLGTRGAWASMNLHATMKNDGFEPHLALHLSEGWAIERATFDPSEEPSKEPDRVEVLVIHVHEREHSYAKCIPITSDGTTRHCTMEPWALHDPRGAKLMRGAMSIQQEPLP
jgi:hypothetical protein